MFACRRLSFTNFSFCSRVLFNLQSSLLDFSLSDPRWNWIVTALWSVSIMGSILIKSTLLSRSAEVNQTSMGDWRDLSLLLQVYTFSCGCLCLHMSITFLLWQIFSNSVNYLVLGGHLSKLSSNTVLKSPPHKISAIQAIQVSAID